MVGIDIPVYCANCGRGICDSVDVLAGTFALLRVSFASEDFQREAVEKYKSENGLD